MTLSDISIKNPVFAVMLSAAMVVFGYLGYRDMGISQFPELDFPVVNITTYREASDPETMDSDVTDIIEDAISSVEGIDYVQSQSLEGSSIVTVYFHLHRDVDAAMLDVQNAVAAASQRLPTDIDPPVISKVNFNKFPVIWLSVHGHKPLKEISQYVDDHIKQQVETIPGCGGVIFGGLRPRNMRIWLRPEKLYAHNLDALDVLGSLRVEHVERPAGYLQSLSQEVNVRIMGEAHTVEDFRQLPVFGSPTAGDAEQWERLRASGQLLRLDDVADVEDGLSDRRTFARFNRESNIGVGVMRATGANVVEVCDEVKRRLPALRKQMPEGMEIGISTDYSLFIKDDIEEVKEAFLYGILLTAVVTYLFLGSIGTTLNVCVSIPTSLMGTFIAMKMFGFTVNFMTLLAMSLSVGVVVDDAILVLENIYRRREHGEARREAALRGAREISFAAIAATLSIAAIFVPVAFMKGAIGRFFFQFGITVTVSVLLSLIIALTITPMLCSIFLTVRQMRRPLPPRWGGAMGFLPTLLTRGYWLLDRWVLEPVLLRPVDWLMDRLARWYSVALRLVLRVQLLAVFLAVLLAASGFVFAMGLPMPLPQGLVDLLRHPYVTTEGIKPIGKELVPSEDQNRFVVNIICPVGSSIDFVDQKLSAAEVALIDLRDPETGNEVVASIFGSVSYRPGQLVSEGTIFVRLIPADLRGWTQTDIMGEVRKRLAGIPGITRGIVMDLSTQGFTPSRGYPVDFAVQGPEWKKVTELSERIRRRLSEERIDNDPARPVVTDVNSDYRPGMMELRVYPDKQKAAQLDVPIRRVAFIYSLAMGGLRNGRFTDNEKRYDVRVRYREQERASPEDVPRVFVKSDRGKLVPLSDLVSPQLVSTLPVIHRYNHLRKVEVTANMAPGVPQGEAITRCRAIAEEVREEMGLPPSYRFVQLGNAMAMQETLDSMWWALALGFVIASMILGVQFNSFIHPFTVLIAVPFGVTGALATLWLTRWWGPGDTLNLMSMIGLVLLGGLVKKNSIILVDYMNQLRQQGHGLREAVLEACPVRLRPILMTTIATIASAVPLALGYGPGAETRKPLARSIIGGLILSTFVTLIIVPVFYVLFDRLGGWVRRQLARGGEVEPETLESAPLSLPAHEKNGHAPKPETRSQPVTAS